MKKQTINYIGKTFTSKYFDKLTDSEYEDVIRWFKSKPNKNKVIESLSNVLTGKKVQMTDIEKYYFRDLIYSTKLKYSKWSIEEVLKNKELLGFLKGRIKAYPKVFKDTDPLGKNIETAFRISGKEIAKKPSNFPLKEAKRIIKKYNINNNYYDFSCGWGVRLLASLSLNINYFGTDVNVRLFDKLNEMVSDIKENNLLLFFPNVDIRNCSSETFISEWENKMGLCFSSPPYYDLEDYKFGDQSIKNYKTYKEWLDNYVEITMQNIYLYLIDGGYFLLNIKNTKEYKMMTDMKRIAEKYFKFVRFETLNYGKRVKSNKEIEKGTEDIAVFVKFDKDKQNVLK